MVTRVRDNIGIVPQHKTLARNPGNQNSSGVKVVSTLSKMLRTEGILSLYFITVYATGKKCRFSSESTCMNRVGLAQTPVRLSSEPRIYVIDGLFSEDECDLLIEAG
eukprot:1383679-Amorphochlora_amoeboformis.AAC.1